MNQSMSGREAQRRIDAEAQKVAKNLQEGTLTLDEAHKHLIAGVSSMSLFRTAGYAKAIACFQCSADCPPHTKERNIGSPAHPWGTEMA